MFSEINLASEKLGRKYADRNGKLCSIISEIAKGMAEFSTGNDTLGDAYEYLIGQFAAGSGKKAGEFYTPQQISNILHYLKDDGVMAIILPHGVLFRGGAEERIRRKLLDDGCIDTVIGLPPNLFYSTGIPVCILVLKKCKKSDDVLFINASGPENFVKGKRQNRLEDEHIEKILRMYQNREPEQERYSRRVSMMEIAQNDYNLNISRYVSTAQAEPEIKLAAVHAELVNIENDIRIATAKHNVFLKELGLSPLPLIDPDSSKD